MTDLNLDQFLQPKDGLPSKADIDSNYLFPSEYERGLIPNTYSNPIYNGYVAVVSLGRENGTFKAIQEAINYADSQNGGSILILPGTYTQTKKLFIPNNVHLVGTDPETTIVDFTHTNDYCFAMRPSTASDYLVGSLSTTNQSTTITGSGTSWLANVDASTDLLEIRGATWVIASVDSDTQITLRDEFNGKSSSGVPYRTIRYGQNAGISNLTITKSSASTLYPAIFAKQMRKLIFSKVNIQGVEFNRFGTGFLLQDVIGLNLTGCSASNCEGNGIDIYDCAGVIVSETVVSNCNSTGILIAAIYGRYDNILLSNCSSIANASSGYDLQVSTFMDECTGSLNVASGVEVSGSDSVISGGWFRNNADYGIRLTTNSSSLNTITGVKTTGNVGGAGLRIDAVTANKNAIVGNVFDDGISDAGTGTGNVIANNA